MTSPHRRRSIDSSSEQTEKLKGDDISSRGAQSPFPNTEHHELPPSYTPQTAGQHQVPPSGYRLPLSTSGSPFPGIDRTREAPFTDADGKSPVFIGSALMQYSVHPCKIAPNLRSPCCVPYGGGEFAHQGRYDLLPFVPEQMEFVQTSHGHIPPGRRPVKGGFENTGAELYHGVADINGVKVPGKTGTHLGGCNVAFGGKEHVVKENYGILYD
ncbi:hypothetical protein B0F90DRAFT_1709420 [Multifurca ochricompacta]|uniref:Uncharacterized protein n=1 Tax=Multifurca ochricompacta TaxID=376703 RepID=A0AAD4M7K3_9AGAM|nr:hypothetical protein B0F90DRAFT_1709420 [Multifurca ochricompacta]